MAVMIAFIGIDAPADDSKLSALASAFRVSPDQMLFSQSDVNPLELSRKVVRVEGGQITGGEGVLLISADGVPERTIQILSKLERVGVQVITGYQAVDLDELATDQIIYWADKGRIPEPEPEPEQEPERSEDDLLMEFLELEDDSDPSTEHADQPATPEPGTGGAEDPDPSPITVPGPEAQDDHRADVPTGVDEGIPETTPPPMPGEEYVPHRGRHSAEPDPGIDEESNIPPRPQADPEPEQRFAEQTQDDLPPMPFQEPDPEPDSADQGFGQSNGSLPFDHFQEGRSPSQFPQEAVRAQEDLPPLPVEDEPSEHTQQMPIIDELRSMNGQDVEDEQPHNSFSDPDQQDFVSEMKLPPLPGNLPNSPSKRQAPPRPQQEFHQDDRRDLYEPGAGSRENWGENPGLPPKGPQGAPPQSFSQSAPAEQYDYHDYGAPQSGPAHVVSPEEQHYRREMAQRDDFVANPQSDEFNFGTTRPIPSANKGYEANREPEQDLDRDMGVNFEAPPLRDGDPPYTSNLTYEQRYDQSTHGDAQRIYGPGGSRPVSRSGSSGSIYYSTSSHGGAGNTTLAWVMANTAAMVLSKKGQIQDKPVWLIESDYRNPKLQERLHTQGHLGRVAQEINSVPRSQVNVQFLSDAVYRNVTVQPDTGLKVIPCPYDINRQNTEDISFAIVTAVKLAAAEGGYVFIDAGQLTSDGFDSLDAKLAQEMSHHVVVVSDAGHISDMQRTCRLLTGRGVRNRKPHEAIHVFLNQATTNQVRSVGDEMAPYTVDGSFPYIEEISPAHAPVGKAWVGYSSEQTITAMVQRAGLFMNEMGSYEIGSEFSHRMPVQKPSLLTRILKRLGAR